MENRGGSTCWNLSRESIREKVEIKFSSGTEYLTIKRRILLCKSIQFHVFVNIVMDNSLNVSATSIYNPKKQSWNDKARWEMPSTWKAGLPISMEHVKSLTTREGSAPRLGAVRHRYRYTWQLPATTAASIVPARLLSSAYLRLDNLFGIVIVTYCPPAHAHSYALRYDHESMEFEEDRFLYSRDSFPFSSE